MFQSKKDALKGMFFGLALGDALGVPFEFKSFRVVSEMGKPSTVKYTGLLLEEDAVIQFQYQQTKIPAASVSDDTEMTMSLFRAILAHPVSVHHPWYIYHSSTASAKYMNWANSKPPMMGRNTRAIFQGVKTLKGLQNRQDKIFAITPTSQSNGSLMRCSPLVLITGFNTMISSSDVDVNLSNPNDINRTCNRIYLSVLAKILHGNATREKIRTFLNSELEMSVIPEITEALTDALEEYFIRDISINRGWVCHAFSISLYTYLHYDNFSAAMRFIILGHPKGDTDTNACIAGALIGCSIGYENMLMEEHTSINIPRLRKFFEISPRKEYGMDDIDDLIDNLDDDLLNIFNT